MGFIADDGEPSVMKWIDCLKQIRRDIADKREERLFFKQGVTSFQCGNYRILAPENHATIGFSLRQPYRDLCIGIAAKYTCEKYRDGTIVDIGANIGDTASIIASHTSNKMILIEASNYYFRFLQDNSRKIPNQTVVVNAFIGDGTVQSGELKHWGGTAHFEAGSDRNQLSIATKKLRDVVDDKVVFIKIDTDGFDYKIINDSLDYLKEKLPSIIFEGMIRSSADLEQANEVLVKLIEIGYTHFLIWDDPGFFITSTNSLATLKDLNRYLFAIWSFEQTKKSISNYDILCLKADDADICHQIREYYEALGSRAGDKCR
jgi:FkbM family methyltransferase